MSTPDTSFAPIATTAPHRSGNGGPRSVGSLARGSCSAAVLAVLKRDAETTTHAGLRPLGCSDRGSGSRAVRTVRRHEGPSWAARPRARPDSSPPARERTAVPRARERPATWAEVAAAARGQGGRAGLAGGRPEASCAVHARGHNLPSAPGTVRPGLLSAVLSEKLGGDRGVCPRGGPRRHRAAATVSQGDRHTEGQTHRQTRSRENSGCLQSVPSGKRKSYTGETR